MSRSETYRQMAEDVKAFRDAYRALLTHMRPVREHLTDRIFRFAPKTGEEAAAAEANGEVSRQAGKAKRAQQSSGVGRTYVVPKIGIPLDPFGTWDHSLKDVDAMSPQDVLNTCDLVIGALEEKADRAAAVDRTFVGRLAAFASIPARVRSIVAEDHPDLGKLAFSVGVIGQIIIGIVSGLILAVGTAGVTAAWKAVIGPAPAASISPSPSPSASTSAAAPTPSPTPSGR